MQILAVMVEAQPSSLPFDGPLGRFDRNVVQLTEMLSRNT